MNTAIYEHCLDIPQKLRERGNEILGHGITNSEEQGHLDAKAEAELIQTVAETIERHEGQRPISWMSPWLSNSEVTADLLQGSRLSLFHGLDLRRSAYLDEDPQRPHPGHAISYRNQ
jgi:hypothetical protein